MKLLNTFLTLVSVYPQSRHFSKKRELEAGYKFRCLGCEVLKIRIILKYLTDFRHKQNDDNGLYRRTLVSVYKKTHASTNKTFSFRLAKRQKPQFAGVNAMQRACRTEDFWSKHNDKMNVFLQALVICFFLSIASGFSQNGLDQNFSPPAGSILGSDKGGSGSKKSNDDPNDNNIHLNVTNLLRSNAILTYERIFLPRFSLIFGLGIPFGIDNIQLGSTQIVGDEDYLAESNTDVVINYYDIVKNSNFRSGFISSFALRMYFESYSDGFLFYEMGIKDVSRNLRWESPNQKIEIDGKSYLIRNEENSAKITSLFIGFGAQWNAGHAKFMFNHELSLGGGFKVMRFDKYVVENPNNLDPFSYNNPSNLVQTTDIAVCYSPYFSVTYCLGFGW